LLFVEQSARLLNLGSKLAVCSTIMDESFFFRRRLPHWQPKGATFFITYRLAGTLPNSFWLKLKDERQRLLTLPKDSKCSEDGHILNIEKKLFAICDRYLDKNTDIQWLAEPRIAEMICDNLYHHAEAKYTLWAYVIMPNHVHVMLSPKETQEKQLDVDNDKKAKCDKYLLSPILHSLRSYTGNKANKILNRKGTFWQHESYDHWVRDNAEFQRIIYYIENNPVSAGLANKPDDWYFSSAYERKQRGLGPFDRLA
jgi:putative transposase